MRTNHVSIKWNFWGFSKPNRDNIWNYVGTPHVAYIRKSFTIMRITSCFLCVVFLLSVARWCVSCHISIRLPIFFLHLFLFLYIIFNNTSKPILENGMYAICNFSPNIQKHTTSLLIMSTNIHVWLSYINPHYVNTRSWLPTNANASTAWIYNQLYFCCDFSYYVYPLYFMKRFLLLFALSTNNNTSSNTTTSRNIWLQKKTQDRTQNKSFPLEQPFSSNQQLNQYQSPSEHYCFHHRSTFTTTMWNMDIRLTYLCTQDSFLILSIILVCRFKNRKLRIFIHIIFNFAVMWIDNHMIFSHISYSVFLS